MHQLIKIIVYAKNEEDAVLNTENILDRICGDGKAFDYGSVLDEDGEKSWGVEKVSLANSKEGKRLIDEGMKDTKEDFMENIKAIRKLIEKYSDDEIFEEEEDLSKRDLRKAILDKLENKKQEYNAWRYYFYKLGQYEGSNIYLYDNDGSGIRNFKHLKDVLNKWGSKDYQDLEIFVVCCDVHH